MTVDEWKALQSRLVDAWEQFTHTSSMECKHMQSQKHNDHQSR